MSLVLCVPLGYLKGTFALLIRNLASVRPGRMSCCTVPLRGLSFPPHSHVRLVLDHGPLPSVRECGLPLLCSLFPSLFPLVVPRLWSDVYVGHGPRTLRDQSFRLAFIPGLPGQLACGVGGQSWGLASWTLGTLSALVVSCGSVIGPTDLRVSSALSHFGDRDGSAWHHEGSPPSCRSVLCGVLCVCAFLCLFLFASSLLVVVVVFRLRPPCLTHSD